MTDNFNQGVRTLLARMDSHPEEFDPSNPAWGWVVSAVVHRVTTGDRQSTHFLTDEEVRAIYDKHVSFGREQFTTRVMKQILHDSSYDDAAKLSHLNVYSAVQQELPFMDGTVK